eukprot:763929-Hanusia_phi.AAC.7
MPKMRVSLSGHTWQLNSLKGNSVLDTTDNGKFCKNSSNQPRSLIEDVMQVDVGMLHTLFETCPMDRRLVTNVLQMFSGVTDSWFIVP